MMAGDKLMRLNKHAARSAAGIVNHTAVWLYQFRDQLDNGRWRVKLTRLLFASGGISLEKILVDAANEIFFGKSVVVDFIDLVDEILELFFRRAQRRKQIQRKRAPQRGIGFFDISGRLIENNGDVVGTGILDDIGPASGFFKIENIYCIIEGSLLPECRSFTILRLQIGTALFKLVTGKL